MRYKLRAVLWVSAIALTLITFCTSPVLAQDRRFLNLSLEFLGAFNLQQDVDTPVGGFSAITYDRRHDRLYALSGDRSQLAPARFYHLKLTLNSPPEAIAIQNISIQSVTLLKDKDGKTYPEGTIAPAGIAVSPQQTVFVASSGVPPSVQEFDVNGQLRQSLPMPEGYLPNPGEQQAPRGVQVDRGFTSLTLNPTGSFVGSGEPINLFTATKVALVQDVNSLDATQSRTRFLHYLIGYGPPVLLAEYLYPLDPSPSEAIASGLVELIAVDQSGHFLSLEQSTSTTGFNARIFQMTTAGAIDIPRSASVKGLIKGIEPVKKKLLLDLNQLGIPLDNLQGMTLGPRLPDGTQSLLVVSDNHFNTEQATQFLLFRLGS